ncbi:MAG TPA: hypothetical protein VHD76_01765 [Bryobacteraceae bacterium]|nr:hypothetical protein [Bryobacteraceae bacterium]
MEKRSRIVGLVLLLVGSVALISSLTKPRVQALHGADILGLIGAGACLGVALFGLLGRLRIREG